MVPLVVINAVFATSGVSVYESVAVAVTASSILADEFHVKTA